MTSRISANDIRDKIDQLNAALARIGSHSRYSFSHRYTYYALDDVKPTYRGVIGQHTYKAGITCREAEAIIAGIQEGLSLAEQADQSRAAALATLTETLAGWHDSEVSALHRCHPDDEAPHQNLRDNYAACIALANAAGYTGITIPTPGSYTSADPRCPANVAALGR